MGKVFWMMLLVLLCTSEFFHSFPLSCPYLLSFFPHVCLDPLASHHHPNFPRPSPLCPLLRYNPMKRRSTNTRTLSRFHGEDIYVSSLFHGVGIFLFSFAGSMFLGVAFGLCCSLGLKHSHLASYPHIESCIVALVAYTSYFFSNGLSMSGEFSFLYFIPSFPSSLQRSTYRLSSSWVQIVPIVA